ncbi:MAG TPA: hypothetical protein VM052_07580 [Candidatus Limnocylindrales bacterium]|nr:hypothetical protein [Candidatus Limnocylindrales bacterium]
MVISHLWQLMESPATDPPALRRRTNWLIAIHLVLAAAALAVLGLVAWRIRMLITLAQRSNVETLVIAFVVIFLAYMLVTTGPATIGALRLLGYRAMGTERAQRSLQRKARSDKKETKRSHMNVAVHGPGGRDIVIPLQDRFGKICDVRLHLTEIVFEDAPKELTHSLLQLVVEALRKVGKLEGTDHEPKIVYWDSIDESTAEAYGSQVEAFSHLEKALGKDVLWPQVRIDREGIDKVEEVLRLAAPAVRENLLLPDIEYSADFTIPIIPEPFAFMQLSRRMEHADAVASMGCATLVALMFLAGISWVIVNPPWVPGK